jgi:glucose-1-phosphate cytidylyltransferase
MKLAKERQLNMYKHDGFWHCMDTYKDYDYLQSLWKKESPPWKTW